MSPVASPAGGAGRSLWAEAWLRRRGFTQVRLRIRGDQARLELAHREWSGFLQPEVRGPFTALAARLGWGLELDVAGGGNYTELQSNGNFM